MTVSCARLIRGWSFGLPTDQARPFEGLDVPEVLKSGHHANIEKRRSSAALSTNTTTPT